MIARPVLLRPSREASGTPLRVIRLLAVAMTIVAVAACHRPAPSLTPGGLAVSDSARWECGGNGGWFGILRHNGVFVDSIDLALGIVRIPDGLLYAPVHEVQETPTLRFVCPSGAVIVRDRTRRLMKDVLPLSHTSFPAATSLGSSVLYWGFRDYRIYAARHDFATGRSDTTFLAENQDLLATDYRFQFLPPKRTTTTYIFETWPGRRFTLDIHMRVIARDTVRR